MDQFTRRFATQSGDVNGIAVCRMFNKITAKQNLPKYLSSDNDPLFTFHRWQENLRILGIEEIKSVPHVPTSHPFVERLIGTIRHELLDNIFFWNKYDLQDKLASFQQYYNENRGHCGIDGISPTQKSQKNSLSLVSINHYQWKKHYRGLFELPIPA